MESLTKPELYVGGKSVHKATFLIMHGVPASMKVVRVEL